MRSQQEKQLSAEEWGQLYNKSQLGSLIASIQSDAVSVWSKEMLRLTNKGDRVLEIGCGTGMTSLYLSKYEREVTAIDYSKECLELVKMAANLTGYKLNIQFADATTSLPFRDGAFDVAFQAGLLEHFTKEKRIELLQNWRPICKKMISMIPNAHSVAYRAGKHYQEKNGLWKWGLELPQSSLSSEFFLAGYRNINEHTIGVKHALTFLPPNHYLRISLERWIRESGMEEDNFGQGYLLVTVAEA